MRIDVTAEDLRIGHRKTCVTCPLALAIARATGEIWWTIETKARRLIAPRDGWLTLPPEAVELVRAVDAGEQVEPISFSWPELDAIYGVKA